jgi:hypothetical protein
MKPISAPARQPLFSVYLVLSVMEPHADSVVGKVAPIRRANFARVALARWRVRIPKVGWHLLAHLLRCHSVSKI